MNVKIKKISSLAIVPKYAHEGDAGMDIFSVMDKKIAPGTSALIGTGIALEIPQGYEVQVRPRSGLALKNGITVLNSPGTIDSGYRGEIGVILINHGQDDFIVTKGMKIAQLVFAKYETASLVLVEELNESQRRANGFGSTGV